MFMHTYAQAHAPRKSAQRYKKNLKNANRESRFRGEIEMKSEKFNEKKENEQGNDNEFEKKSMNPHGCVEK